MTEKPWSCTADDERGVVTLTLNRPQAFNSLSEAMLAALQSALDRVGEDRSRPRGGDRRGRQGLLRRPRPEGDARRAFAGLLRAPVRAVRPHDAGHPAPAVPVIARVHGIATAAGCQLVAMCDLAVAAREARFAVSGVNLGLFCSTPSVALSRNLPRKQAFEMLVTGDFISADEALARAWSTAWRRRRAGRRGGIAGRRIVAKPRAALALGKQLFYRQLEKGIAPPTTTRPAPWPAT
jgi:enoyl-CoA hydratase/carnithine racemase